MTGLLVINPDAVRLCAVCGLLSSASVPVAITEEPLKARVVVILQLAPPVHVVELELALVPVAAAEELRALALLLALHPVALIFLSVLLLLRAYSLPLIVLPLTQIAVAVVPNLLAEAAALLAWLAPLVLAQAVLDLGLGLPKTVVLPMALHVAIFKCEAALPVLHLILPLSIVHACFVLYSDFALHEFVLGPGSVLLVAL